MSKSKPALQLTESQVLYFRARRGHLAGPGAADTQTAARDVLGAQAQQLPPALYALSLRTKGRPNAEQVRADLFAAGRSLVRTWGQRGTLHIYDAAGDWAEVIAAWGDWAVGGRGGPMPTEAALQQARAVLEAAADPLTRSDLLKVTPKSYVRAIEELARLAGLAPERLAAGRLLWMLALRGVACTADKLGSEQAFAARSAWFPDLPWPNPPANSEAAFTRLSLRYLAVHGPATVQDLAHFFGARVRNARQWWQRLEQAGELIPVSCGDRQNLAALARDERALRTKPPPGAGQWPTRLLPLFDTLLMGHSDKSWTVPDQSECKLIWKKAAMVRPVVISRGRFVATWSQKAKRRQLLVEIEPLGGWQERRDLPGVRREAQALAEHLGLDESAVSVKT